MRPLQPLVEIFRQLGGAGRALPSRHKTHPASMFGGPRLVRRPLGIIHVTDVYVVFGFRRCKSWLSPAPGYLGTRDEKSGLNYEAEKEYARKRASGVSTFSTKVVLSYNRRSRFQVCLYCVILTDRP